MKQNKTDHIYRDGRHYDRLFGAAPVSFWLDMARQTGGPILELGCGTGKIAIPLAEAGFEVVGVDLSEAMLKEAQRKTENMKLPIRWVHGDMRAFSFDQKFKLIILPSNNLCHLLSLDDVEECFQCVKNALAADGRFVIDVFVPSLKILLQDPSCEEIISEYDDPDGAGKVTVAVSATYEPDTQIRRNITQRRIPGRSDETGRLDMRMFFPQELDALLKYNGFRIIAKFGNYNKAKFGPTSDKQLIVATTEF